MMSFISSSHHISSSNVLRGVPLWPSHPFVFYRLYFLPVDSALSLEHERERKRSREGSRNVNQTLSTSSIEDLSFFMNVLLLLQKIQRNQ